MTELPARCEVAVIGAGITGLTAAFQLARRGVDVVVIEAADRVGGTLESRRFETAEGHWRFEAGPNTIVASHPEVGDLVREAGLEDERLIAEPAAHHRYIWKGGELVALPSGPRSLLTTPLLSWRGKARLLREPFVRRRKDERVRGEDRGGSEESIADFVRRRLGHEILDFAVAPFVSGVYAGDPERLSMRWALPQLSEMEAKHRSLVRAMVAAGRSKRRDRPGATTEGGSRDGARPRRGPAGTMFSFRDGLDTLPARLAEAITSAGGTVLLATPCRRILGGEDGLVVETAAGQLTTDQVLLTVPAQVAAAVLDEATAGDSTTLAEVPYVPVAVASFGVPTHALGQVPDGFGFLVPRRQEPGRRSSPPRPPLRILGCLFPSTVFPGRAPQGHAALTAFAGGRTDPTALDLGDTDLLELFRRDLETALGLPADLPVPIADLRRWPRAIPQYELGHARFAALRTDLESRLPGLHLAGNYLDGISVPDRIRHASRWAELQSSKVGPAMRPHGL